MNRKSPLIIFVLLTLSTFGVAKDKPLTKAQLPSLVRKTADEQSKSATIHSYSSEVENGKLEYEVQLTLKGRSRDVTIAPDGRVLEVEDEVPFDELPASARDAIKHRVGTGTDFKDGVADERRQACGI